MLAFPRSGGSGEVLLPHLELAGHFDRCVDELASMTVLQPEGRVRDAYVDLLVALTDAAKAMRSSDAGDGEGATEQLRSAVELLCRTKTDEFVYVRD
ncbi:hypothetical protein [Amycolatopsis sp. WQ 127309]|uniref:hypothetical protein n=1 Tax=Amycolatopsis sp. WQ 127309 TaxID=2932773 RepID=UPI001FF30A4D|nr:hypothetical protein [Amycolatopsis sp. WQ 127309]UOZ06947.1 hypothetical protein MUY22_01230 [Amycolatopsis sp. WQ 127309]